MDRVIRYGVPIAFLAHGLGMIGGVYFVATQRSWLVSLLGDGIGSLAGRTVAGALWVVSGVAFVVAAWLLYQEMSSWHTWAWVAAPLSLVGIALWAGKVPAGTYVGAGLDVAVIVALLMGA